MGAEPMRARLPGLDWIRGIAATWVLLYHVDITLQKAKYFSLQPLSTFTSVGYRGVELFFLLSGFVMARTYDAQVDKAWTGAISFAVRRALRILPAYIVLFVPLFALAAWKGLGAPPNVPVDGWLFLSNLLLLPRDDLTTYIPVSAWTLTHELMFYVLFVVAFLSWRAFLCLLTAWVAVCLGLAVAGVHVDGWRMVTSGLNAYFLLGVLCSRLALPSARSWDAVLPLLAVVLLGLAISLEGGLFGSSRTVTYTMQAAYAGAFFFTVWSFASERLRLPPLLGRAADFLGRVSYGIYLVNYPVVVGVALLCKALGMQAQATVFVATLSLVFSLVLAEMLYRYVEQPGILLGKRLFRRPA